MHREHRIPETRWIWLFEDRYRCPKCLMQVMVEKINGEPIYLYCPLCGANVTKDGRNRNR